MCATSLQRSFLSQILPNIVCSETEINQGIIHPWVWTIWKLLLTVKLREPLRLISDLSIMCKRKPIRYKIAKVQPIMSLTFMVSGFFLQLDPPSNWLKNNKHLMNIPEIILIVQFSVELHSNIKQGYLDNQSRSMQLTIVFCRDQTGSVHEWK